MPRSQKSTIRGRIILSLFLYPIHGFYLIPIQRKIILLMVNVSCNSPSCSFPDAINDTPAPKVKIVLATRNQFIDPT